MLEDSRDLYVTPRGVLRVLLGITSILLLLHLGGVFLEHVMGHNYALGFVPMFDVNSEQNVPTLFSSILLISCGALCALAGVIESRWRARWWFLALVFLLLGIDETFGFHEPLFFVLRGNRSDGTAGLADLLGGIRWRHLLPWLALFGCGMLAWYWSLARHVGNRVLIMALSSAVVYSFGVIGIDSMLVAESEHNFSLPVSLTLSAIEELCEFVGASLFIYAVLLHFSEHHQIAIRITSAKGRNSK